MRSVVWIMLCLISGLNSVKAEDETQALLKTLLAEVQHLRTQVDQAHRRIDELEGQLQQAKAITSAPPQTTTSPSPILAETPPVARATKDKPLVTAGDVKGTFKIPGSDTSVGLGGYVKTDLLLNSVSVGSDRLGDQNLHIFTNTRRRCAGRTQSNGHACQGKSIMV